MVLSKRAILTALALCGFFFAGTSPELRGETGPTGLELATFFAEITPPMGHPLCGGWIKPVSGVDDPQLAKGVILRQGGDLYVLCALDWCEVCNDTYDHFRRVIAEAAGTAASRVAVQTIHQHNALLVDSGVQKLLDTQNLPDIHCEYNFLDEVAGNLADAVEKAMKNFIPVTQIGTGKAKVENVASSRRLLQPDGSIVVRFSSAPDPKLRALPEGNIDPWLRTVSFYNGETPVARLHYYATHPQSYYGDGRTNYEFPGMARERLEAETGVFQVYFTGCGGDIAAGKYNDGTPPQRPVLAQRMYEGMVKSVSSTTLLPISEIGWKTVDVRFPLRTEEEFSEARCRSRLENPDEAPINRIKAARTLAWIRRVEANRPVELSRLAIGPVRILHLPGEPMVEFQFEAQRIAGEELFAAVAGYGDGGMGYICTAKAYEEGGYEPTASLIAPESERILKDAIAELLR